jgi:GT2 family glycosyltransferase
MGLTIVAPEVVSIGDAARRAAAPRRGMPAQVRMMETAAAAGLQLGDDVAILSPAGFFLEGWADDRRSALVGVAVVDFAVGARTALPVYRVRRPDVEDVVKPSVPWEFGFWAAGLATDRTRMQELALSLVQQDGTGVPIEFGNQRRMGTREFFEFLLSHFGRRPVIGNRVARSFADLEAGHGKLLGQIHTQVATTRAVDLRAQFGTSRKSPRISLICVLYGIPDFLYLAVSEYARFGPLDEVEFVFVSNSPELAEVLVRDAELAHLVFGANITLVVLNQNCGFSYANNVGVAAARSRRIGIVNPDVFPREPEALAHMLRLADEGFGNDIVGGKLYYADGSVMHEGMFFEPDRKLTVMCRAPVWTVEHYRKGFADTASAEVRPVPALTGALMLLDRKLFEAMQGFDGEFIYGHYEDADLCLRVRQAGGRALLDPRLAYWHYEGMGSAKRPEHGGSHLYNRWRFSLRWGGELEGANNV